MNDFDFAQSTLGSCAYIPLGYVLKIEQPGVPPLSIKHPTDLGNLVSILNKIWQTYKPPKMLKIHYKNTKDTIFLIAFNQAGGSSRHQSTE